MMARSFTWFSWIITGLLSVAAALDADSRDSELSAVLVGPTFTVQSGTVNSVGANTVAYNRVNDEYFIVWTDWHVAGRGRVNQNDIYGRRVAADGGLVGGVLDLHSDPDGKFEPSLVHDPIHNQYLVTWLYQGGAPGSPGFNHAYGRLIAATGSAITAPQDYSAPGAERTMVFNPGAGDEGEFFFLGRSFATDFPSGIYHQRVSSAGAAAGAVMIESEGAPAPAGQVAFNPWTSQYLVTWREQTLENLNGRIVSADGSFVTDAFEVAQFYPVASGLAAGAAFDHLLGRYLVVFGDFYGGPLRGQLVAADGSLVGPPISLVDSWESVYPCLAYDPTSHVFLLVWHYSRYIYCQLVSTTGAVLGDPLLITNVHQSYLPTVAANTDHGGFLVVWRNTASMSLHGQLVGVQGSGVLFMDGFEARTTSAWSSVTP